MAPLYFPQYSGCDQSSPSGVGFDYITAFVRKVSEWKLDLIGAMSFGALTIQVAGNLGDSSAYLSASINLSEITLSFEGGVTSKQPSGEILTDYVNVTFNRVGIATLGLAGVAIAAGQPQAAIAAIVAAFA